MSGTTGDFTAQPHQRGAAILVVLLIVGMAGVSLFVTSLLSARVRLQNDAETSAALAQAKDALLGFAVSFYEQSAGEYGFLPCPNLNIISPPMIEGAAQGPCGSKNANSIGRLPWKSLGLPPLRDGYGECLWYVVAGPYKNAAAKTDMLNEDSNGLIEIFASDGVTKLAGIAPGDRPVAVIFAPGQVLNGQDRTSLGTGTEKCGGNYTATNYLDTGAGMNNGLVSGTADAIDRFIAGEVRDGGGNLVVNDRLIYITRKELFAAVKKRNDFAQQMSDLTFALARCAARYGSNNGGGAGDKRLPWPAPVALVDYRIDASYDDHGAASPALSGRLPNVVGDSRTRTSNTLSPNLITDCPSAILDSKQLNLWRHWKDHFFYAVARAHEPDPPGFFTCFFSPCVLRINNSGSYAAVVMFSGERVATQGRNSPPTDIDEKQTIANYLEGRNASNHPDTAGNGNYQVSPAGPNFNDVLYCVQTDLNVVPCS